MNSDVLGVVQPHNVSSMLSYFPISNSFNLLNKFLSDACVMDMQKKKRQAKEV